MLVVKVRSEGHRRSSPNACASRRFLCPCDHAGGARPVALDPVLPMVWADQIVSVLVEAEEANKEVERVNGAAPDGEHRRLAKVDLVWAKNLVLPDSQHPDRNLLAATTAADRRDLRCWHGRTGTSWR
jgi:hypothetical protein